MPAQETSTRPPLRPEGDGYVVHPGIVLTEVPVKTGDDGICKRESAVDHSVTVSEQTEDYGKYRGSRGRIDSMLESARGPHIPGNRISDNRFRLSDIVHVPGWLLYRYRMWRTGCRKI